jgi:soluble calcium-activated nucleotidase 1
MELKVGIVADLDQMSKIEGAHKPQWKSIFKKGTIKRYRNQGQISYDIEWELDREIVGILGEEGRGMEFSELVTYHGKMYTVDDRTGVVYELTQDLKAIPRHILMEGDGENAKGQKSEWATEKDGLLYIGSFGKEYVNNDGTIKNRWNMWVSVVDKFGRVTHEDWTDKYEVLRKATGASWPGYMIHEAIHFDEINRRWVVLPRRVSGDAYNEKTDERMGSNLVLILDENFTRVEKKFAVGPAIPLRGWSTFKFQPGSNNDIIVAVKTEEEENKKTGMSMQRSFITVFRISDGAELMEQTPIPGGYKFEGLEFL